MLKKIIGLSLVVLMLGVNLARVQEAKAASASVPLSITVNGNLVVSDAADDTASGTDPTKNVSISITPDLGSTIQTGTANIRLRTNKTAWRLTAQRTASSQGGTAIEDTDVLVDIATSAGSNANASSGATTGNFTSQTDLTSITTASAVDVITGTAKTSSARDNSNTNNHFNVNTTYSIDPDFFYTEGTFASTITYSLVSP